MFHSTTTATNTLLSAYDEGDDIIVVISGNKPKPDERWFSRYTGRGESFREGEARVYPAG